MNDKRLELLSKQLYFSLSVLKTNLAELSEKQIRQGVDEFDGKSIHWQLGHILMHRLKMLAPFNLECEISMDALEAVDRGAAASGQVDFSHEEIVAAIASLGEQFKHTDSIDFELDEKVMSMLGFYVFHESYHVGQVGLMRRSLGLKGAIA